ncbi:hypothetical protein [Anaeromicropila populeti]|uniref:Uncharacterized protein n=1 Tax=Anaeromicropila populeti TaxID=37658 RepID=A0A1I6JF96_9FIRM|nr:hypothetical protein [Anaeromicropila populeti]SFR77625.1 hypothetical protein SAMN05661086_01633 [Anaeromicropila populeti]
MDTLQEVINYLIELADAGALARILYCFIRIKINPDEASAYLKRIKHAIWFVLLANMVWTFKILAESYYK